MKNWFENKSKVMRNLPFIPEAFHSIYLELVEHTYIVKENENWINLIRLNNSIQSRHTCFNKIGRHILILEQGECGLRENFFRANRIQGRLDLNYPFTNVTQVLQFIALASTTDSPPEEIKFIFSDLSRVNTVVILSDISISGSSLAEDCRVLRKLFSSIGIQGRDLLIVAAVCRCTESSAAHLAKYYNDVFVGDELPMSASLRYVDCPVGLHSQRASEVIEITKWFRENLVSEGDIVERMEKVTCDPRFGLWGFGAEGWLLAGEKNTPNNTIPLLWHNPKVQGYIPPFPRTSSRLYEDSKWNIRSAYWQLVERSILCSRE